jgi:vacuolar iron transporter family protein
MSYNVVMVDDVKNIPDHIRQKLHIAQINELTEAVIYHTLATRTKNEHNRRILNEIAAEEEQHAGFWKKYTGQDLQPNTWHIFKYTWLARLFGLTFAIKLMENGEKKAQINYGDLIHAIPDTSGIREDEAEHEDKLIAMIDEERLAYIGSVVLGLNDALVELSGVLAGFTLALQETKIIAMAGLITGIASALSMALSEYFSTKTEGNVKSPVKAALYTGVAYVVTVFALTAPFLIIHHVLIDLLIMLAIAWVIIFLFTFYTSTVKNVSFKRHFWEMTVLSFTVAGVSFALGYIIKKIFGVHL